MEPRCRRSPLPWRTSAGDPHTADLLFVTPDGSALDRNDFNRLTADQRLTASLGTLASLGL